MRKFLSVRILFLAALAFLVPAASRAQVSLGVSIRVGPPALPVYEQPPCPEEGYMWTPGIGLMATMGTTGCQECGSLRHALGFFGRPAIGAGTKAYTYSIRAIGVRTSASTVA